MCPPPDCGFIRANAEPGRREPRDLAHQLHTQRHQLAEETRPVSHCGHLCSPILVRQGEGDGWRARKGSKSGRPRLWCTSLSLTHLHLAAVITISSNLCHIPAAVSRWQASCRVPQEVWPDHWTVHGHNSAGPAPDRGPQLLHALL